MNDGEMRRLLIGLNPWWKKAPQRGWETQDPDLKAAASVGFQYRPDPLQGTEPDGLYVLGGPRRVGKSLELKRAIVDLLDAGTSPRRVIFLSCTGLTEFDLRLAISVGRDIATAQETEPRYWFLDEITSISDWPAVLTALRNTTRLRADCVVVTGSDSREYPEAKRELAGRHGVATHPYRLLLPMTFRSFVSAVKPEVVTAPVLEISDLSTDRLAQATYDLQPWLNELIPMWEIYVEVGGYPRAVADYLADGEVSAGFVQQVWQGILGDLTARRGTTDEQVRSLLESLARRLCVPVPFTAVSRDIGIERSATYAAKQLVESLTSMFITWPCYQRDETTGRPSLSAYPKIYFLDPLPARLSNLRVGTPAPTSSQLTEQMIGAGLLRAIERVKPEQLLEYSELTHVKLPSRGEVDFVTSVLKTFGIEGKYVNHGTKQEAKSLSQSKQFGSGILVTNSVFDTSQAVRQVPASMLAYLLN